jgi:hypothetical protein
MYKIECASVEQLRNVPVELWGTGEIEQLKRDDTRYPFCLLRIGEKFSIPFAECNKNSLKVTLNVYKQRTAKNIIVEKNIELQCYDVIRINGEYEMREYNKRKIRDKLSNKILNCSLRAMDYIPKHVPIGTGHTETLEGFERPWGQLTIGKSFFVLYGQGLTAKKLNDEGWLYARQTGKRFRVLADTDGGYFECVRVE